MPHLHLTKTVLPELDQLRMTSQYRHQIQGIQISLHNDLNTLWLNL